MGTGKEARPYCDFFLFGPIHSSHPTSKIPNLIEPGAPVQNAFVESFNGTYRDECLNENWFLSLADARTLIENWRIDYNEQRPHGSQPQFKPQPSQSPETLIVSVPVFDGRSVGFLG